MDKYQKYLKSDKGFAPVLLLVIFLLISIPVGLYLVYHPQIFKPRANEAPPNSLQSFNTLGEAISTYRYTDFAREQVELTKKIAEIDNKEGLSTLSPEEGYQKIYGESKRILIKDLFGLPGLI